MNETKRLSVTMTRENGSWDGCMFPSSWCCWPGFWQKASGFWAGTPGPYWVRLG